jgi:hypothetical protein
MGKLAERLADARRSGVYRVETAEALEEAAALNGFALERLVLKDHSSVSLPAVGSPRDGQVLLFSGHEARAVNGALQPMLAELETRAKACREEGGRFFAVFLDPSGVLPLAPLYNWKRR